MFKADHGEKYEEVVKCTLCRAHRCEGAVIIGNSSTGPASNEVNFDTEKLRNGLVDGTLQKGTKCRHGAMKWALQQSCDSSYNLYSGASLLKITSLCLQVHKLHTFTK